MKKKLAIIGVALVVFLVMVMKWSSSASYLLAQHWQAEFIKEGSEMYCFHEDNVGYYSFMYDSKEDAEALLTWQDAEGETKNSGTYTEAAEAWMEAAGVPETISREFYAGPYYYESQEDGSEMIVFLDGRLVHVVEHMME